ncbi:MAG: TolC family protein [Deltaproteobacteria bacterium]|nr:TolC family protein [Deltaproteobacteria bacterium]
MKRGFSLLLAAGAMIFIQACTGYQNLKRSWETYEPTSIYKDYSKPATAQPVPPTPANKDFEKQVEKLQETKRKWEDALGRPEREDGFYRPDPSRLSALLPAAKEPSLAREVLAKGFTLEDLEILALLRNPGVKAGERNLRASIEAYSQVSNLDEILRQYSAFTKDLMPGIGPMAEGESMELKFPFPGVLALKGEVATQEVEASREREVMARRMAITQARQAYWNLLYNRRAQKITGEMLFLLRHLESVATKRYETGKTSFQDLIKIRIERDKMEEELKTIREQQRNIEVKILEILNLPPGTIVSSPVPRTPQPEVPPLDGLFSLALTKRQELREMRAMIGKMERMIEMAETMIYPPYSPGFSLFPNETIAQTGTMRMKEPFPAKTLASTGVGLPRNPWYGTNDAYLRETRQKLAALREELRKKEDETVTKVREAWFRLDRAKREEELYAVRVVNLSQASLEVSTRAYGTGNVAFADVIMSYTGWLNDNLALEMKRSEMGMAQADLEEVLGGPWR